MNVTDHFDFLIEDASRAFFQEVAADRAAALPRPQGPAPLWKTASRRLTTKLASEIEADLVILERAGPVGAGLGMTKRAIAHLERLADDPRLHAQPGVMPDLFGKVAATAVATDIAQAADELCKRAAPDDEARLRREVVKLGLSLTTELERLRAGLEKSAAGLGLGSLERAGLLAKELRGASNVARGYIGAAEEGLGRIGRKWRAGEALKARGNLRQIGDEIRGAARPSIAARSAGAERAIAEAQKRQLESAEGAYKARRAAAVAKSPAGAAVGGRSATAPGGAAPKPPSPPPAAAPTPSKSAPTTAGFSPARAEAERRFARITGGGAADAPEHAGEGGGSSSLEILKKLHTQGWSGLAPHEKTRLVAGGVGLIGAHRLMTGRDLLTGQKDNDD